MSSAEYTAITSKPLSELKALPFWQVVRYLETLGAVRRRMVLQALAA